MVFGMAEGHTGVRGPVMLDGKGAESVRPQGEPSVATSSLLALASLTFSVAVRRTDLVAA